MQNFSRARRAGRKVGFPRFRAKHRCRETVIFQRPRVCNSRHVEFDRRLGPVRAKERMGKLLRLLAEDERARILRATVSREGRSWYVSFTVERSPKRRAARLPNAAVGVDLGVTHLATLSERVFACSACGHQADRDLNAAMNLAVMARRHAQVEGLPHCYVAAAEAETRNARREQVSPAASPGLSSLKREASNPDAPQRREAPAAA